MARNVCTIAGCGQLVHGRGWCGAHYQQYLRRGHPLERVRQPRVGTCAVTDCARPIKGRGYCARHLARDRKYGSPVAPDRRRVAGPPAPKPKRRGPKRRPGPKPRGRRCDVAGCGKRHEAQGFCSMHYRRWQLYRDPFATRNRVHGGAQCEAPGCEQPGRKVGLCQTHYTIRVTGPRRRARKLGAAGSHTHAEWQALLDAYGSRCAYCDAPATCRDHVVPLSRGGSDAIANIVPACRSCNSSKGARLLDEWRDMPARQLALFG